MLLRRPGPFLKDQPMPRPTIPPIKLRTARLLRQAQTLTLGREATLKWRQLQLAGHKALIAARHAYQLEEELFARRLDGQWQARRQLVESELARIAKLEVL
jgi:hypothetical protein